MEIGRNRKPEAHLLRIKCIPSVGKSRGWRRGGGAVAAWEPDGTKSRTASSWTSIFGIVAGRGVVSKKASAAAEVKPQARQRGGK